MSKLISNILIFIYFIIFSLFFSFAHAEDTLGDTVENLKTCGQGKTYDEDSDSCGGPCAVNDSGAIIIASNGLPYDAGTTAAY